MTVLSSSLLLWSFRASVSGRQTLLSLRCFWLVWVMWICVISHVGLANHSAVCSSCMANTLMLDIIDTLFKLIFHTYHAYRYYLLQPFYTTFNDLDLGWEWQSVQSRTCWLHSLALFSTDEYEIWYGIEAIQVEHPDTTWVRLAESREITWVLLTASKTSTLSCMWMFMNSLVWM